MMVDIQRIISNSFWCTKGSIKISFFETYHHILILHRSKLLKQ